MEEECHFFQGPVGVLCQALVAVLAFSALIYKRSTDMHKIDLGIWILNVSKQVISMAAAHMLAMIVSIFISYKVRGASACSWYVVVFSTDTILGTMLTYVLHTAVVRGSKQYLIETNAWIEHGPDGSCGLKHLSPRQELCEILATCGYYGTPPSLRKWAVQAAEWTCCVVVSRVFCALLVYGLAPSVLEHLAKVVDALFQGHVILELYAVMIVYPLIVNSLQALIQDAILRAKSNIDVYYTTVESIPMQEFIDNVGGG